MNSSFTSTDYFYSKLYYDSPAASANGTVDEDEGSSLPVGMMFGSIGGRTTLASDPVSTPSTGYTTSSRRTSSAMLERRASITHYTVTCSTTIYACGTKLFPSAWILSTLHPSVYPRQMAAKSRSG